MSQLESFRVLLVDNGPSMVENASLEPMVLGERK